MINCLEVPQCGNKIWKWVIAIGTKAQIDIVSIRPLFIIPDTKQTLYNTPSCLSTFPDAREIELRCLLKRMPYLERKREEKTRLKIAFWVFFWYLWCFHLQYFLPLRCRKFLIVWYFEIKARRERLIGAISLQIY